MMVYCKVWSHSRPGIIICLMLATFTLAIPYGQADDFLNEPVETLDTIEVPATALIQEERNISIPFPTMTDLAPFPSEYMIPFPPRQQDTPQGDQRKMARDPIADVKGKRTQARPAKAERPPYPKIAREQGWEGTVVLRITVNRGGSVDTITTQKSSGFPILDDSALQSVKKWTFEPAKDGEFAITETYDFPIHFDLTEK